MAAALNTSSHSGIATIIFDLRAPPIKGGWNVFCSRASMTPGEGGGHVSSPDGENAKSFPRRRLMKDWKPSSITASHPYKFIFKTGKISCIHLYHYIV